jgi:demethylmenaquinone methyltransferase / 2-methoxy-6-polyprenyl-1,4-benzoquinol methylase
VLRLGGRLVILEFSHVWAPLKPLYDLYSFRVLPWLGERVVGSGEPYRYLAESIRMHPDQAALKSMLEATGFGAVEVYNLAAGVVAVHRAVRF